MIRYGYSIDLGARLTGSNPRVDACIVIMVVGSPLHPSVAHHRKMDRKPANSESQILLVKLSNKKAKK